MPIIINGNNTPTAGAVGYGNGTELAFSAAGSAGNILLSGGSGAPTWSPLDSGVATWLSTPSSANLAAAVTDETGSGSLVFANSPTLATPSFTTSATFPLHIGGTGTTSTLTLRSTSGVGTTGADIILQTGNNGATEAMRVLNSGNVGIGTATPGQKLTVDSTAGDVAKFQSSNASGGYIAIGTSSTSPVLLGYGSTLNAGATTSDVVLRANSGALWSGTQGSNPVVWYTSGAEKMRLDASGNLAIGGTPPTWFSTSNTKVFQLGTSASLWGMDVSTSDRRLGISSNLYINASGNFIYAQTGEATLTYQNAGSHFWYNSPSGTGGTAATVTERMRLNSSGELCVATTTAAFSAANRGNITIGGTTSILGFRPNGVNSGYLFHDGTNFLFDNQVAGPIAFNTNTAERMRIQSNGFVGIGTNAPTVASANATLVHLHQASASTPSVVRYTNGSTGATSSDGLLTGLWVDNNAYFFLYENADMLFATNSAERMRIASTGNIGMGTASPQCLLHVAGQLSAVTQPTLGSYANSHFVVTQQAGLYGLNVGVSGNGDTWLQTQRFDSATAYNMQLNPAGGNVGIGTSAPAYKLDVRGAVNGGIVTYNRNSSAAGDAYSAFILGNDTVSGCAMFLNSSTRTVDGGANAATIRNDAGSLYLKAKGDQGLLITTQTGTSGGNVKLGGTADRATTVGTNHIDIFNGTAPAGTLANGISLYSSGGEAYVMDAAGNATLFSPHDSVTNEWIFRSKHTPTGKVLRIDVEKMLRFINDHFGLDMIQEFTEE